MRRAAGGPAWGLGGLDPHAGLRRRRVRVLCVCRGVGGVGTVWLRVCAVCMCVRVCAPAFSVSGGGEGRKRTWECGFLLCVARSLDEFPDTGRHTQRWKAKNTRK